QQAIPTLNMRIQKTQRFTRLNRFHPEANFAKLNSHGIYIDTVDAATDSFAQGVAVGFRGGLFVASADSGQSFGDTMGGGHEEMTTAAGRIADFEVEDGSLSFGCCWLVDSLVEN